MKTMLWLLGLIAGAVVAFATIAYGTPALMLVGLALVWAVIGSDRARRLGSILTGAGLLIIAELALANARCANAGSTGISCTSPDVGVVSLVGVACLLFGIALTMLPMGRHASAR